MTAKDNRLFVEAVLYRYRAGIPWRDPGSGSIGANIAGDVQRCLVVVALR